MNAKETRPKRRVVSWDDPYWQEDLPVGKKHGFFVTIENVECHFTIEADSVGNGEIGWARVVGLAVGPLALVTQTKETDQRDSWISAASGSLATPPLPDAIQILTALKREALETLTVWEESRRFYRSLKRGFPDLPAPSADRRNWILSKNGAERRALVASMHNLLIERGIENPGSLLPDYLGIGRSTYFDLIRTAELEGQLKGRGREGRPRKATPASDVQKPTRNRGKEQ